MTIASSPLVAFVWVVVTLAVVAALIVGGLFLASKGKKLTSPLAVLGLTMAYGSPALIYVSALALGGPQV